MKRTLIISAWAPPQAGGSPIILGRLLHKFPKNSYLILTSSTAAFKGNSVGKRLPAKYFFIGSVLASHPNQGRSRPTNLFYKAFGFVFRRTISPLIVELRDLKKIIEIRNRAVEITKNESVDLLMGTSDNGPFLLGSYLASRRTGVPLYVFLFDLYAHNNFSFPKRVIANLMERIILRHASRVFVTNDKTAKYYRKLYQIEPTVVEHTIRIPDVVDAKTAKEKPLVTYTGAIIYWAQKDSVINLIKALNLVPEVSLKIFTALTKEQLERIGVWGDKVSLGFSKNTDIKREQSKADILFLPMGFETPFPEIPRTASPGKLPEYLVSGVPILVHAPPDSYIAEDARKLGWGLVVDQKDPVVLASAIKGLLADNNLRKKLVRNAFAVAKERHDQQKVSDLFLNYFR
ncbi:MAG: glycosyltransferase [Candidatus Levyibacteriota bacterium]